MLANEEESIHAQGPPRIIEKLLMLTLTARQRQRLVRVVYLSPVGAGCAYLWLVVQHLIGDSPLTMQRQLGAIAIGVLIAALVGAFEFVYLPANRGARLRQASFGVLIATRAGIETALIALGLNVGNALWMPVDWGAYVASVSLLQDTAYAFCMLLLVLFFVQVRQIVGGRLLIDFVLGRYHRSVREQRVFLFLDLVDSSRMAEQLGDEGVHALLRDFFIDVAGPVLDHRGETHRYVGDQVVVTWPQATGIERARCLRCVFEIDELIKSRAAAYVAKYGLALPVTHI